MSYKIATILERRSGQILLMVIVLTAMLAIPMAMMAPEENASDNPGGTVYELEDLYNSRLPTRFHGSFYLVEAGGGDVLTQASLLELRRNTDTLRQADREGDLSPVGLPREPYLFNGFDVDRQQPVIGIYTLADAIQEALALHPILMTSLKDATEDEVKVALHVVLSNPGTSAMKGFIYGESVEMGKEVLGQKIDYWTAPAFGVFVAADNEKLGGGARRIGAINDPVTKNKEQFSRNVQATLRGDQVNYELWGVAIDASLEIADEVGTAVPYIAATFFMVLIVVGISMRSARVVLLTGIGLVFMIIWLKGLSNLVGLKSSTTLDFIVPIAMISLGADFMIHAVSRYREERRLEVDSRRAFRIGIAGVLMALVLAMVTDAIAFLSNASADIETVVGFGIGAALAIIAAFVIMGLAMPMALMRLDSWRTKYDKLADTPNVISVGPMSQIGYQPIGGLVVGLARLRWVVVPMVLLVTIVAGYYALRLEASFDVRDFFKSDSDFVIGLDKLDYYVGQTGGESGILYIEGDLTQPSTLSGIKELMDRMAVNPYVAKNDDGEVALQARPLFFVLEQVMSSRYARAQIEESSGVALSADDSGPQFRYGGNNHRWPNSADQLKAIYEYITVKGVPLGPDKTVYDYLEVGETLFHDLSGQLKDATAIVVGIPGTREQTIVIGSRDTIAADVEVLAANPHISRVGLTGSPYTRQAALDATTDGLQRALVIAVISCLVLVVLLMRSVRFGVVTIIPIGLVVVWLYAFMYAFGFGLNFVTATIAAVSIGVGVDFAIHMTQRFREELGRTSDELEALYRTAQGTGIALLASAATSVVGFTIMAFAPMPLFAAYGILTAVMIFLALVASLLVLPSLLIFMSPSGPVRET